MGLFVKALNTVIATLLFEQGGKQVAVMPSFRKIGGGITIFNLTSFTNALNVKVRDGIAMYTANDCSFILTQCQRQHVPSDIAASSAAGLPQAGSLGGHAPNVLALRYELSTSLPGRSYRGSLYWPSISADLIIGDEYNHDAVNAIQSNLNDIRTWALGQGWEWVLRSKYIGRDPRTECIVTPIDSITKVDYLIDTQRRRKAPLPDADGDLLISFE